MGGKTSTSTQSVSIPPEVLARYNAVNARAESVAQTPFQQYGGQFVAGLTPVQQQGIQQTSQAATLAQPYYGLGTAYTMSGAQDVGPLTQNQIGYYENPYTNAVAAPTYQALRQQQGQELSQQQSNAIRSGAAYGDRYGLERANLMRQQALGTAQAMAPIFQQGYGQAVQTAQQQQGVIGQDLARRMQAGQQIAGLGTGAQQAALQGAQATLAAGTAEQQTQQADLTARYQQFLQERGYPFQVAQFLANIAMGTGALSGSTTTTTQPAPFFSDKRLKHDAHRIGETDDGIPIYSFKYNGDDRTQIGLMAQDVEKRKPEAVGLAPAADGNLYKTVDYAKATRKGRDLGGLVADDMAGADGDSMGGAVGLGAALQGFAPGGLVAPDDWKALLANIGKPIGAYGQDQALGKGAPFGGQSYIDPSKVQGPGKLATAASLGTNQQKSGLGQAMDFGKQAQSTYQMGKGLMVGSAPTKDDPEGSSGLIGGQGKMSGQNMFSKAGDWLKEKMETPGAAHGGLIVRHHYEDGGDTLPPGAPDEEDNKMPTTPINPAGVPSNGFPSDVLTSGSKHAELATAKGGPNGSGQNSLGSGLKDAASLISAGKTLWSAGQSAMEFLPLMLAANGGAINPYAYGGLVPRERHADGEEVGGQPVSLFDMPVAKDPEAGLVVREEKPAEAPAPRGTTPKDYFNYLVNDLQYKPHVAGAIIGNMMQESRGNATVPGDNGESYGLFQFHNRGEMPAYRKWAQENKRDLHDPYAQIDFVHNRLQGPYARTFEAMNATEDPAEATRHFMSGYERPHADYANLNARIGYTRQALGLDPGELKAAPDSGSARRPGVLPTEYSGVPARQASLGDVASEVLPNGIPTESSFWVPALGFLGSMLSSRSPYLGSAIGEGLVGGVSAYQANQRQQMEMAKDMRAMFDSRFIEGTVPNNPEKFGDLAGQRGFWDKTSQRWLSPEQLASGKAAVARDLGIKPAYLGVLTPKAPERPSAPLETRRNEPATTNAQPNQQPAAQPAQQPAKPADVNQPAQADEAAPEIITKSQLIDEIKRGGDKAYAAAGLRKERDPRPLEARRDALRREIESLPPGSEARENVLRNEVTQLDSRIDKLYDEAIDRPYKQMEANFEENKRFFQTAATDAVNRQQLRARIQQMEKILNTFQTTAGSQRINDVVALMQTFGIDVPDNAKVNPTAFQAFVKDTMKGVFDDVKSIGGQLRVAEMVGLQKAAPDPNNTPEANRKIMAEMMGRLDYLDKYYQDATSQAKQNKYRFNVNDFTSDWVREKDNNPTKFRDAAYSEIAPRGGTPVTPSTLGFGGGQFNPGEAKVGATYIIEPGMGVDTVDQSKKPMKLRFMGTEKDSRGREVPLFKRVEDK